MVPLQIEVLLHYYAHAGEHRLFSEEPPISLSIRKWLIDNELLRKLDTPLEHGASYQLTRRGLALVEHIMNLPLPEKRWIMPK